MQKNKINNNQLFSYECKVQKDGKTYTQVYMNQIAKKIIKYWNQVNLFKSVFIKSDIYVFLSEFNIEIIKNNISILKNIRNHASHDYNFWEREDLKRKLYGSSNFNNIFEKLSDFFISSCFLIKLLFLLSN